MRTRPAVAVAVIAWLALGALLSLWLRPTDVLGFMKVMFLGPAWCVGIALFAMKVISPGATSPQARAFRRTLLLLALADLALWGVSTIHAVPPVTRELARLVSVYPVLALLLTYAVVSGRDDRVTGFRHPLILLLGFVAFLGPWLAIKLGWVTNPLFGIVFAAGFILSTVIFYSAVRELFPGKKGAPPAAARPSVSATR